MRSIKLSTIAAALMFCLAGDRLYSQWEIDGPGAALRINGVAASIVDPIRHDVGVPLPSTLTIDVLSGANAFAPVLLAASGVDPDGSVIRQIPGLGIVNIGAAALPLPTGIHLIGDGIGRTVNPLLDILYVTSPAFDLERRLRLAFNLSQANVVLRVECAARQSGRSR